jgi:hypothetical protein
MKLLLILGSDETNELISLYVSPLGFDLIRYRYVLKAMDNMEEIDPAGIIISARDFPRHWKILVQFVRSQRSREECPIIILKGENLPLEESSKAFFLGVSGIVAESLETPEEIERLQAILGRYIPLEERRKARRYYSGVWNRLGFLVFNPLTGVIIPGEIKNLSASGLSFLPINSSMTKDITLNMELPECSLRIGEEILSPVCRLVRTGRIISLEFISFPENERKSLENYLEALPLMEAKSKQTSPAP